MNAERTMKNLSTRLSLFVTRHRPSQLRLHYFSRLIRPKKSPLQGSFVSQTTILPRLQRRASSSWASTRAYSSPPTSSVTTATQTNHTPVFNSTTEATLPSSSSTPEATTPVVPTPEAPLPSRPLSPSYQISFTCKPCRHRSTHMITKQGYHHGAVAIQCPACNNRHVISDHLGIFLDKKMTIKDLMRQQGHLIKRGTLGPNGDVEFWKDEDEMDVVEEEAVEDGDESWEDGTVMERAKKETTNQRGE